MSINNILYFNYGEYQFQLYKILLFELIKILNPFQAFKSMSALKIKNEIFTSSYEIKLIKIKYTLVINKIYNELHDKKYINSIHLHTIIRYI